MCRGLCIGPVVCGPRRSRRGAGHRRGDGRDLLPQDLAQLGAVDLGTGATARTGCLLLALVVQLAEQVAGTDRIPDASETSREAAAKIAGVLDLFETVCAREEAELGRIDAIAGDGDHGQGMAYGSKGAAVAARTALEAGAGARTLLLRAGDAWAESAGGTSGAL